MLSAWTTFQRTIEDDLAGKVDEQIEALKIKEAAMAQSSFSPLSLLRISLADLVQRRLEQILTNLGSLQGLPW